MFYLAEFGKILKENKILAIIFLCSTIGAISVTHFRAQVEKKLSLNESVNALPYFNALISQDINLDSVIRRMGKLPGVAGILKEDDKGIKTEVEKLKKSFGESLVKNLAAMNYKKIKIQLEPRIKTKNMSLIKEYLTRLVGSDHVTLGNIKNPKKIEVKNDNLIFNISSWGIWYAVAILSLLSVISLYLLTKPIAQTAFIIEKFQRLSNVYFKIISAGVMGVVTVATMLSLVLRPSFDLIFVGFVGGFVICIGMVTGLTPKKIKV